MESSKLINYLADMCQKPQMFYGRQWNYEEILISLYPNPQIIGLMKPCQTLLSQHTQWKGRTRNKRKWLTIAPINKNPQPRGRKRSGKKSCT
jgi:hypothetical protein